jgi:Domain of unknown function (DUF2610)
MKSINVKIDADTIIKVYISDESAENPIRFQSWWYQLKGVTIPSQVVESLTKLRKISSDSGIPFEKLCSYALDIKKIESQQ